MAIDVPKPRAPGHAAIPPLGQIPSGDPPPKEHDLDEEPGFDDVDTEESVLYGPPFEPRSFGAELVWAKGEHYVAKILRVRAGQLVKVSALRRRDMVLMLTGGRAQMESLGDRDEANRQELQPGMAFVIDPNLSYRLNALTDVELFTVYTEALA